MNLWPNELINAADTFRLMTYYVLNWSWLIKIKNDGYIKKKQAQEIVNSWLTEQGLLLLSGLNFNSSMDKWSPTQ